MLLPVIDPVLKIAAEVPSEKIPFAGKFAPEFVIVLFEIVTPVFPVVVPVSIRTVPDVMVVPAPLSVKFVKVSV